MNKVIVKNFLFQVERIFVIENYHIVNLTYSRSYLQWLRYKCGRRKSISKN